MASAKQRIFKCDFFNSKLATGLKNLLHANQLSDVALKAQGREFRCHKSVLAAQSEYFLSMFTRNFKERMSEEIRMPPEIDASAMETLVSYFYSGLLALSQNNIDSVFRATDYMRLNPLLELCIEYMQETLDESNCIRWYVMAESIQYFSPSLDSFKKAASGMIMDKVGTICETPDFLSLSTKLISKILDSNNQPEKAEALYMVILSWVRHDEENRRKFLGELLEMLPVDGISHEFFTSDLRNEELLRRDAKSFAWLLDNAMKRVSLVVASQVQPKSILITDRVVTENQECFRVKLENPTPLAICDRPKISRFSAVSHKKRIYLICGDKTEDSYRLDDPQGSWVHCALDLKFGRNNAGCVVLGDDLFVVGGVDWRSGSSLKSCVKFNFGSGRKENLPEMDALRQLPGVADYANSVYAACGYPVSPTIERFDPREGRWGVVGRYTTEIGACSSAAIGDSFYSCDVDSGALERFDFRGNRSQQICSLPSKSEWGAWISSVEGDLFGVKGRRIFKYNATADEWNAFCSVEGVVDPIIVPWI